MRCLVVAVGRNRTGPLKALFDDYALRLKRGGLLGPLEVKEVEEKRRLAGDELKAREAELLLAALPEGAAVVALDERGATLDSEGFARRLGRWRDDGRREVAFLIGGADGLTDAVRRRADLVLSFGSMTWPHMLVRTLLAEQLFRADCILTGHPYHRAG